MHNPRKLFCFGLGFSAQVLAKDLMAEGWQIAGTCREPETRDTLIAQGMDVVLFDRQNSLKNPVAVLAGTTHLLSSVPPDKDGDAVLDLHGTDICRIQGLEWAGYLSTTGVYGNTDGAPVTEASLLNPSVERAKRRVLADRAWRLLGEDNALPIHIFRLSGIYGPGRSLLDTVRAGKAKRVVRPGQRFSRIYVEDISQILRASFHSPDPGAIYNLADDDPAPPAEVTAYACCLLGIEPPPEIPFDIAKKEMSPMALTFWADNRLVDNSRIKEELGIRLRYPSYKSGLSAILEVEKKS